MKSPGRVRRELDQIRDAASTIAEQARQLAKEYEEAYDAGIRSLRSGAGTWGDSRSRGSHSDPTGDSATSYEYRRLRSCTSYVARRIQAAGRRARGAIDELTTALTALHDAWLDLDPDLREQRRAQRESARAVVEAAESATDPAA